MACVQALACIVEIQSLESGGRGRVWQAIQIEEYPDICPMLQFPGAAVEVEAVSYTHLRAHETVLDLVCRLLLEKKNNNEYSI